jgi:hypothetical protein
MQISKHAYSTPILSDNWFITCNGLLQVNIAAKFFVCFAARHITMPAATHQTSCYAVNHAAEVQHCLGQTSS